MRFSLGRTVATPGAIAALERAGLTPIDVLRRHAAEDWGDLDAHDRRLNDLAVQSGDDRILSRYDLAGDSYYCITEFDRSATTILLVSEY